MRISCLFKLQPTGTKRSLRLASGPEPTRTGGTTEPNLLYISINHAPIYLVTFHNVVSTRPSLHIRLRLARDAKTYPVLVHVQPSLILVRATQYIWGIRSMPRRMYISMQGWMRFMLNALVCVLPPELAGATPECKFAQLDSGRMPVLHPKPSALACGCGGGA